MKALQWEGTRGISQDEETDNNKKFKLNPTMRKQSDKSTLEEFCKTTGRHFKTASIMKDQVVRKLF